MKDLELGKVADAAKIDSLEAKAAKQERMTKYWNERAPHITHCLQAFQVLVLYVQDVTSKTRSLLTSSRNLQEARRTLLALNQDVSGIDQALSLVASPPSRATAQQQGNGIITASNGHNTVAVSEQGGESRLAQGSSADLKALNSRSPAAEALHALSKSTRVVQAPQTREASSDKRKRADSWGDADYDRTSKRGGHAFQRGESRIAMPPPATVTNVISNVHAYASPRHRGPIYPTNHFPQLDAHAEHTVMTPGSTHYTPQTHYLTSAQSQGLETGGDYRSPAVYGRYPTMEPNIQDRQYPDARHSGAATFHGNPEEAGRLNGWYQFPEPRFEQRAPSTATLNRSYLPQHPSSDPRAPSTATLNRSYLPHQHSSFSDRRTTPATSIHTPFRAPRPIHPTSYSTNPHTASTAHASPTNPPPHPFNDGELDHHYRHLLPHRPTYLSPTRRLTLPQTPRAPRTGLLPHMRSSTPARQPLASRTLNPQSAVASPFFGRREPRARTANQQIWNGLSFVRDPSVAAARQGYSAGGRRNVRR